MIQLHCNTMILQEQQHAHREVCSLLRQQVGKLEADLTTTTTKMEQATGTVLRHQQKIAELREVNPHSHYQQACLCLCFSVTIFLSFIATSTGAKICLFHVEKVKCSLLFPVHGVSHSHSHSHS